MNEVKIRTIQKMFMQRNPTINKLGKIKNFPKIKE